MSMRQFGLALAFAGTFALASLNTASADMTQVPSPNGTMVTEVDLPAGKGPFPVVIFSHGRSGDPRERAGMRHPASAQVVSYWTNKGFAVVAPIRPGYGPSGGFDAEENGGKWCTVPPDYSRPATGAATAIVATVEWVRHQPWAQPDQIVLHGQSVGGLGTVAAAARNPPGVVAYINFAGGAGGFPKERPGDSCRPDLLTDLYRQFGSSTHIPGIWFYASNDEFWGPQAPRQWGQAYDGAGGHALLVYTGPVPNGRGHTLFNTAPQLWEVQLNGFLRQHGFR